MGLNRDEDFIVHLARLVRPKLFVKYGLFQCALFNRIIPYAEKSIGVDTQPEAGSYMKQSQDARFVKGTTQEFAKELEDNRLQINMLYIDEDHSKEEVPSDYHEFYPFIAPQGLILLHDSHSKNMDKKLGASETVNWALEIMKRDPQSYELMPIPASPCLTVCRKRQLH